MILFIHGIDWGLTLQEIFMMRKREVMAIFNEILVGYLYNLYTEKHILIV